MDPKGRTKPVIHQLNIPIQKVICFMCILVLLVVSVTFVQWFMRSFGNTQTNTQWLYHSFSSM